MDRRRRVISLFLLLARRFFHDIFDDFNDEDSSSDEEDVDDYRDLHNLPRERNEVVRTMLYLEVTVPGYSGVQFQSHFRLTRDAYEDLLRLIGPRLARNTQLGRPTIDPERQLLSVIWLLATPESYRSIGDRFNMSKSSLWVSFERVITILNDIAPDAITWPRGDRLIEVRTSFQEKAGIENIIGAVDGTFVPIKAPQVDPEVYVTRKCNYAFTLQAICEPSLKFIDVFTGYPGSVSDTRIFKNSDIYHNVTADKERYFPPDHFIIGDKAYPVLDWCIPPYIERAPLTAAQRRFNHLISSTRQTIERSFALLFGRFRRLKYLDMSRTDLIPATILASCVMHNICLMHADVELGNYEDEGLRFIDPENEREEPGVGNFQADRQGQLFRDNLCRRLNIGVV